ncbi:MAG: dolichol kinase [Candidatus Odinarchaeum yellowstonii]|uniref:Dolichol kinase n=1 Tax=Odinarchaeota yellowstonii (strain LCB_4) TaxID=1841599 RepID=A0AAF0D1T7_ODILC|nr:MAG: dolichol kinase [Candidatus Odinarchaeum yellowstonii]
MFFMINLTEIIVTIILFIWVTFVVTVLTKKIYTVLTNRGTEHTIAVYYNRKVVHMLAGGVSAIVVGLVYTTPILPLIFASLLAVFVYIPHRAGKLMTWFQVCENCYEVSFAIMWGVVLTLGWFFSGGNFWFGVLPALFMSFGDAVTGVVRNAIFKRRTKSWYGNLAMASVSIPTGAILGPMGVISGAIASLIEHFEFGPIDDNVTVPAVTLILLLVVNYFFPGFLSF